MREMVNCSPYSPIPLVSTQPPPFWIIFIAFMKVFVIVPFLLNWLLNLEILFVLRILQMCIFLYYFKKQPSQLLSPLSIAFSGPTWPIRSGDDGSCIGLWWPKLTNEFPWRPNDPEVASVGIGNPGAFPMAPPILPLIN
jgi:hypothetical protein